MKIAIIIFVLSTFLYFKKVEVVTIESYNNWYYVKFISFILMICSFITIVVMW